MDIVTQYLLKNFILIGWLFPLTIGDTQLFSIMLCGSGYDLIAAIGTASSVFSMIIAISRFYSDHLFYDFFHCFVLQACIFCQLGISQSTGICCSEKKEKEKSISSSQKSFYFKSDVSG